MEKSWIFVFFSRSPGNLIFQGKVMDKSWNFTQTVSSVHDVLSCMFTFFAYSCSIESNARFVSLV